MCDECCICLSVGCPTKINPSGGDGQARICPRCNNGSVFQAESQRWLEICFLPLFPFRSKDVWSCNICSWQVELGTYQPLVASTFVPPPFQMQMGYSAPMMTAYGTAPPPPAVYQPQR
ncbi:hypothetical protein MJO28_013852 [Puccinia striiformis f. sp. tritici]|uniref:Zinc-ribbon 15 domain-containing protein n=2 Tax=Puccinia striiformis f. sp. tritici TaxID=168172 RepID=A0A0L0V3C5_9BASI|nr:hypothetical protein Pst134EA_025633 [Puccinia striiformis f. sp. tritici]KAI9613162.1 hypothetical protein H4Q26_010441 [Puccinia striiformis f. sp. tritici PST-130]KNE93803.1 hypothetical protein PSTG_12807 [Puccinia striiformis f. sp. tritici PST-78]KAH9443862.1 hypothetical protein Pst134EB_026253 [Puccinia striiformis f. sp. tritici]KAH9451689.1 hypothetical protein Pst134EA_025633 [Puccinia striiformis f. sp. tritici]KAI7940200.1 hypothetical protein MJO28_013852 [Puccinia striiformis